MDKILEISSPGGDLQLQFTLTEEGEPVYWARYKDTAILDTSALGFELVDAPSLRTGFEMTDYSTRALNDVWEMPWGEQREVSNHYNELTVEVREMPPPNRRMRLIFRVYDDGFGFRYEVPEQEGLEALEVAEERTEFQLTGNHTAWWIPGDWDIYEHLYNETSISGIDALSKRDHPNLAQTAIPVNAVNTPVTMRTASGLHLSFHEAALTDYAGMTLMVDNDAYKLTSNLVGSERTPYKVKRKLPFHTPWRTVQVSPDAAGLIESNLIVNLNEPNQLGDVEWFKPTKYVGIWWEMHLGKSSWDMASGKHGATTENAKRYIDFAAENNIGA
ncbi:MAG: glycoside hydrolase family 97 N-terminal domain-containing protein, partial [bacterium]|nr:glycoside hydrolase family 97 N-terminal domain-containing protein [bacterium]